ncbi:glycosyltransferase family 2 protein [Paenibacillus beijingensis]|uniref:Glycosyltransferase n=1 Tax=Paenibacillus beijingensis TaxID=1126833 RepID=A0A0D5NG20_9BACL|nr:hypothetical protein [Paenibacillus beijingensis]AJY74191.1 hypothetical protein VN24_05880 [Paenibacillus beijingensis]
MKYFACIGYVNRQDLLRNAILSVQPYWPHLMIIDNSEGRDLRNADWLKSYATVYEPPVPFNFCQMMNYLQKLGAQRDCDFVLFMHNDAEPQPNVAQYFLDMIKMYQSSGRKWGVAYTAYDILVAFNIEAAKAVGPWDTNLPSYYTDCDYYWRMKHSPYEIIETGLPVTHHNGGGTTHKSDSYKGKVNECTFKLYEQFYITKWGGTWYAEKYPTPFNR